MDAACRFQQPFHFQQPHRHYNQTRLHRLALAGAGGINDGIKPRMFIGDQAMPG
jgi:hypothetical protein